VEQLVRRLTHTPTPVLTVCASLDGRKQDIGCRQRYLIRHTKYKTSSDCFPASTEGEIRLIEERLSASAQLLAACEQRLAVAERAQEQAAVQLTQQADARDLLLSRVGSLEADVSHKRLSCGSCRIGLNPFAWCTVLSWPNCNHHWPVLRSASSSWLSAPLSPRYTYICFPYLVSPIALIQERVRSSETLFEAAQAKLASMVRTHFLPASASPRHECSG